jgi:hypothetical protein
MAIVPDTATNAAATVVVKIFLSLIRFLQL